MRSAAPYVSGFQWPCGTAPTRRCPRGERPYCRTIFVVTAVSSIKIRRRGSRAGCSALSSARAAATSGRSCSAARRVFFEGNVVSIVEPPDQTYGYLHLLLGTQPRSDFFERQVRLCGNEFQQPPLVPLERRAAVARARLRFDAACLHPTPAPADRGRGASFEQSSRFPRALAILEDRNRPQPKNRSSIPSPSCAPAVLVGAPESDLHVRGNPLLLFRFTSSRKRSSSAAILPATLKHITFGSPLTTNY